MKGPAERARRLLAAGLFAASCTSCGSVVRPARTPPRADVPDVREVPTGPLPAGQGRLLLDSTEENAKVVRVTRATTYRRPVVRLYRTGVPVYTMEATDETFEPLCETPCAAVMPPGPHTLRFISTDDPRRTSTSNVEVAEHGTTVVRHSLGYDKPPTLAYHRGLATVALGGVLLVAGTTLTIAGLLSEPSRSPDGTVRDPGPRLVPIGVGVDVVGLGLAVYGLVYANAHRPERQAGATTQFALPR